MSHQCSLLSSNTAGSGWPDFSSSLLSKALMFAFVCMCVCVHKLFCGCHGKTEKASRVMSPLLPLFASYPSERKPSDCSVCLTDALPIVFGFEGRCWESHSSCSHHSGYFSWINRDLLTRKCKQVDWSESGHENIYCCGWNAENAAVLNMKQECCHDVSLSVYHLHHHHFQLFMRHLKKNGESCRTHLWCNFKMNSIWFLIWWYAQARSVTQNHPQGFYNLYCMQSQQTLNSDKEKLT